MTCTQRIGMVICISLALGACSKTEFVPVEVKRDFAAAPAECRQDVPADLPRVPDLPAGVTSAAAVNAHWAAAWLKAREAYWGVRDGYRVCQRHVQLRAKRQG